jgi:sec-independent protein translocase protein TatB
VKTTDPKSLSSASQARPAKDRFDRVLPPFYDAKEAQRGYSTTQMFSVPHLVVLFIVVLVFFGPHKLPELARGLGKLMAEFRKASNDFKMAFEEEMRTIERQAREAEWKKSQEAVEAKQQAELSNSNPGTTEVAEANSLPAQVTAAEPTEPLVAPVPEAIARDTHASLTQHATEEAPAESAPSSDAASSPAPSSGHDQRQPA